MDSHFRFCLLNNAAVLTALTAPKKCLGPVKHTTSSSRQRREKREQIGDSGAGARGPVVLAKRVGIAESVFQGLPAKLGIATRADSQNATNITDKSQDTSHQIAKEARVCRHLTQVPQGKVG